MLTTPDPFLPPPPNERKVKGRLRQTTAMLLLPAAYNKIHYPPGFDLSCLLTSNQLTLTLPWVKARTGSSMAVGQTLSLLHVIKGKGRLRETINLVELKDHVLNRLLTGRCPRKSLQLRPKFHSLFLQNSFDFQMSATFKGLKSAPRMY